ncbi:MAG: guanylate kinase [Verrucomicrobia bacterium]|nr:MAG: guanylate kinase [Verrucomicrobiota bacterium]
MLKGLILVISGPAGSGKNTVAERLIAHSNGKIRRAITTTSRPPRGSEKEGVDYYFLSAQDFEKAIENGDFYEYAKVHDRYYGTSRREILGLLESGKDIVLIIDVQGAQTWREIASREPLIGERLHSVFIRPPSIDELRRRLANRGTESEVDIERRMKTAQEELRRDAEFEFVIDSGSRDDDFKKLSDIYSKLKSEE